MNDMVQPAGSSGSVKRHVPEILNIEAMNPHEYTSDNQNDQNDQNGSNGRVMGTK
jgi:hypothetical protein